MPQIKLHITDKLDLTGSASTREITKEGYLKGIAAVTKVGIQYYQARDFGIDSNEMVAVFRPPETVFHPETMESIKQIPITMTHPNEDVNSVNHNRLSVGSTGEQSGPIDDERMGVNFVINDKPIVDGIISGEIGELSLGYDSFIISVEGSYNGESYGYQFEGPMINNHLAVLEKGDGRCGESVKILDNGDNMKKKDALKLLKDAGCPASILALYMKDAKDEDPADMKAFVDCLRPVKIEDEGLETAAILPQLAKLLVPSMEKMMKTPAFQKQLAAEAAALMLGGEGEGAEEIPPVDAEIPPGESKEIPPVESEDVKSEKEKEMDSKVKDAAAKRVALISLVTPFLAKDAKVNDMSDRDLLEGALVAVGFDDCKDLADDQLRGRLDAITHDRVKAADSLKAISDGSSTDGLEISAPISAIDARNLQ